MNPFFAFKKKLKKTIYAVFSKITMQRYEDYFWHCRDLSPFVTFCHFFLEIPIAYIKKNQ